MNFKQFTETKQGRYEVEVWAQYDASENDLLTFGMELITKHGGNFKITKVSDYVFDEDGSSAYVSVIGQPPRSLKLYDPSIKLHVEIEPHEL